MNGWQNVVFPLPSASGIGSRAGLEWGIWPPGTVSAILEVCTKLNVVQSSDGWVAVEYANFWV